MAQVTEVTLPDIGDFKDVEVIEVLVSPGDHVEKEDSLITLESDKASMEIPSPLAGTVKEMKVKVGDRINEGDPIALIEAEESRPAETEPVAPPPVEPPPPSPPPPAPGEKKAKPLPVAPTYEDLPSRKAHASPAVRRFARELGVDLALVKGSGPKGRILKEDVQAFVKGALAGGAGAGVAAAPSGGAALPPVPSVDFGQFGEVEEQELSRIKKISGSRLHASWVNLPHVTQFDEADITELEAFRKSMKAEAEKREVRLTFLPFLMKACVAALQQFPQFNASLSPDGQKLILKKYYHIGVAVDTPNGLVVPVIRDVDQKGVYDLARELMEVSSRAREGKLSPNDMQGGCFTISSLGGIGGTQFTPIINAPEVAILGVSRARMQPVWNDSEFEPRLVMPFSLSYDHRVIDGAEGVRFTSYLGGLLGDIRKLLL